MENKHLGEKIREYRLSIKMTQAEFADRLGITGAAVSAYENGTRLPSYDILIKISNILGVTIDSLLGKARNPQKTIDVSSLKDSQILILKELTETFSKYNQMNDLIKQSNELNKKLNSIL